MKTQNQEMSFEEFDDIDYATLMERMKANQKLFVAMSHELTPDQITDFGGEVCISKKYTEMKCSQMSAKMSNEEVKRMASNLIREAILENCTHIAVNGEPALVFHSWNAALMVSLVVLQSTTERVSVETTNPDGTVTKTQIFKHVQWREITNQ